MNRSPCIETCLVPLAFAWSYAGVNYRVTPWPEVKFERQYGAEWIGIHPSPAALAAGGIHGEPAAWRAYLEFVPTAVRDLLGMLRANRLAGLQVAARCPDLVGTLIETPALTTFVAEHAGIRGYTGLHWPELNAVFERGGVFALLERLGLPATRQAVAILRNLVSGDLAPGLLEPLRKLLWKPQGIFALAHLPAISDREIAEATNVLAA